MVGSFVRLAAAALLCAAMAGCASAPSRDYSDAERSAPQSVLQCVPYARDHSSVSLFGDAYTWWAKAEGRFARSTEPSQGAVMVLYNYAGPNRAHVAVVRDVVSSREIRVDHANWLDDGAVYLNDPVEDVSPANDWSLVRVFNIPTGAWGARTYQVQGFIGPGPDTGDLHLAQNPPPPPPDAISGLLSKETDPGADSDGLADDDPN